MPNYTIGLRKSQEWEIGPSSSLIRWLTSKHLDKTGAFLLFNVLDVPRNVFGPQLASPSFLGEIL
jgi:hypothetical protein